MWRGGNVYQSLSIHSLLHIHWSIIHTNTFLINYSFISYYYILIRCRHSFSNNNVKVAVEYERGVKIHFAKCVVFLKDSMDDYFVVVQWYDAVGRQPFNAVSGLPEMVLRPPGVPKSYSVMPINSIVNGAIITRSENQLWVLLSPREAKAYENTNNW